MTSKNTVNRTDVQALVASAGLAADAADALVANLDETVLAGCIGMAPDDLDTPDATLVSVVLDMSGSMSPHQKAVVGAYNTMLKALAGAKAATSILVTTWTFNDARALLSGFEEARAKPPLSNAIYRPDGGTALFDAILSAMTGLVAYGEALEDGGVPSKRVLFVLSDGDDNMSKTQASAVRAAATALAAKEAYTLAFAGFGGGDLGALARSIGFLTCSRRALPRRRSVASFDRRASQSCASAKLARAQPRSASSERRRYRSARLTPRTWTYAQSARGTTKLKTFSTASTAPTTPRWSPSDGAPMSGWNTMRWMGIG